MSPGATRQELTLRGMPTLEASPKQWMESPPPPGGWSCQTTGAGVGRGLVCGSVWVGLSATMPATP